MSFTVKRPTAVEVAPDWLKPRCKQFLKKPRRSRLRTCDDTDLRSGRNECGLKALSASFAHAVGRFGLAGRGARQLERKRSLPVGSALAAVTTVPASKFERPTYRCLPFSVDR
jgi:hypothetical protein